MLGWSNLPKSSIYAKNYVVSFDFMAFLFSTFIARYYWVFKLMPR